MGSVRLVLASADGVRAVYAGGRDPAACPDQAGGGRFGCVWGDSFSSGRVITWPCGPARTVFDVSQGAGG